LHQLYSSVIEAKSRSGWEAERSRASENIERDLRVAVIKAERDAIFELLREERINSEVADKLIRELDLLQTHHDEK
jgi:CPA1 family monovalent cation:H+ antiporter